MASKLLFCSSKDIIQRVRKQTIECKEVFVVQIFWGKKAYPDLKQKKIKIIIFLKIFRKNGKKPNRNMKRITQAPA